MLWIAFKPNTAHQMGLNNLDLPPFYVQVSACRVAPVTKGVDQEVHNFRHSLRTADLVFQRCVALIAMNCATSWVVEAD